MYRLLEFIESFIENVKIVFMLIVSICIVLLPFVLISYLSYWAIIILIPVCWGLVVTIWEMWL